MGVGKTMCSPRTARLAAVLAGLVCAALSAASSPTPSDPAHALRSRIEAVAAGLSVDGVGGARELERLETASGLEIRIAIEQLAETVPPGAEARALVRLGEGDRASFLTSGGESDLVVTDADPADPENPREGPRLGGLVVTDARGRRLPARLKPFWDSTGHAALIVVETEDAEFPLNAVLTLEPRTGSLKDVAASPEGDGFAPEGLEDATAVALFAPIPNDNCADAIVIPNGQPQVFTAPIDVMDATTTGDPILCATVDRTIWYLFTAPVTGTYTITTCAAAGALGTTMPDTLLAVLSTAGGCVAPGPGVACNDDDPTCAAGAQSTVSPTLTAGQSYYIVVGRYAGVGQTPPAAGATSIQILVTRPPANDSCAGTIPALALDRPVDATTLSASNDYQLSNAVPTCYTLPGPPVPVGQTVSTAAGRDIVYRFTAPSAGSYSFRVTGYSPTQNAVLYLSSTCPTGSPPVVLGAPPCVGAANRTITSGPTAEEIMCIALSAGQTVYAIVDHAVANNAGSGFRLEVNRCAKESEPNNTPGTANPAACPVEGSINPANNVDFFALGTPAAGSRVFAISDGVAANDNDQALRVTTTVDTLEFDDDDNFIPFGALSPNVSGSPLTGVAAFLRVSPFSTTAVEEPYRLYAVVQPPIGTATAEIELNNSPGNANAAGTNYFSGILAGPAPSTDVDVFRFTARAGTLVMVSVDGDPQRNNTPIDPKLELLDAAGTVLVSVSNSGASSSTTTGAGSLTSTTPFSPGEALTYRATVSGFYYARVSIGTTSATAIGAGDYLLSIALDCAPGDLDADGVADAKDCAPASAATWSLPGEAAGLTVTGRSPSSLSWSAPAEPGT